MVKKIILMKGTKFMSLIEGSNTSEKILMLLARNKAHRSDLATLLGYSVQTIYNRLEKNEWTNLEIDKIAAKWDIGPADLI